MISRLKNHNVNNIQTNILNKNIISVEHFIEISNSKNKQIHLYNKYHLGDNVFNIHFLNKLSDYLEKNNIYIIYYLQPEYINQVSEFVKSNNIVLLDIKYKSINKGFHLWIQNKEIFDFSTGVIRYNMPYNVFFVLFYNIFSKKFNLPLKLNNFYYEDVDLLSRYEKLEEKYKDVDILIVNSLPMSHQLNYIEEDWIKIIDFFSKKYKTIITKKIKHSCNAICTLDDNLTIKDIGALSTRAKIIIAVNTGVVSALLNKYTLDNILHFCNLDDRCYYTYPNFTNYKSLIDINVNYLIKILDENKDDIKQV